jgi:predicted HD phosphohydrolase
MRDDDVAPCRRTDDDRTAIVMRRSCRVVILRPSHQGDVMDPIDTVFATLSQASLRRYGGVDLLAHALQCGMNAERAGAPPALIAAALLHDIGSCLVEGGAHAAIERGEDAGHEQLGASFLSAWFGAEVTEPVRLHVDAKRYLTATEPAYRAALSETSRRTLELQGGPLSADDAARFTAQPHAVDAIRLRRWDEAAKLPDRATPPLEHFRPYLAACLRARPS